MGRILVSAPSVLHRRSEMENSGEYILWESL